MPDENELTPEEAEELKKYLGSYPTSEEKMGIFSFLNKVLKTKDTSKVSNLDGDELYYIRSYQSAAKYAGFKKLDQVEEYLKDESEIVLATANSKQGFLVKAAITSKKEIKLGDEKPKKSGWFSKKEEKGEIG